MTQEEIRSRKREKQKRYQQHKARLGREASPSPSRKPVDLKVEVSEGPSPPTLPTPPRSKALSSPYIQSRLSKGKAKEEVKPPNFPKRHNVSSRKSELIQQMRAKQLASKSESSPSDPEGLKSSSVDDVSLGRRMDEDERDKSAEIQRAVESAVDADLQAAPTDEDNGDGAFDMRHVIQYPPTPPSEPEAPNNADEDAALDRIETTTDVAVFNPMDDEFVQRLRRIEEAQQEEKKEKDEDLDPPPDATWDVSNPVFEQNFGFTSTSGSNDENRNAATDAVDMFATASWEQADTEASFPDLESHFLRLMQDTAKYDITANLSFEQKQVLEDVKRNIELASGIDKTESEFGKVSLVSGSQLETTLKGKPLPAHETTQTRKCDSPSLDGVSLLGIVSRSEDSAAVQDPTHIANDIISTPIKEDEPLLLGVSSSDAGDFEVEHNKNISFQERVESYSAPQVKDEYSSSEEEPFESDSGDDEIGYISQTSDEEDDDDDEDRTVDILNPLDSISSTYMANTAPTFTPSAVASQSASLPPVAEDSDLIATIQDTTVQGTLGSEGQSLSALTLVPPPPPPPPPASKKNKKKKRGKKKSKSGNKVPLLAPPPEEKLKKWEEEKNRGANHLASLKVQPLPQVATAKSNISPKDGKTASEDIPVDTRLAEKLALASSNAASQQEQQSFSRNVHVKENQDAGTIDEKTLLLWLARTVLRNPHVKVNDQSNIDLVIRVILEDDESFNTLCSYMAETVNNTTQILGDDASFDDITLTTTLSDEDTVTTADYSVRSHRSTRSKKELEKQRPLLKPMSLSEDSQKLASGLLAANFVSFVYLTSKVSKIPSPFGSKNPFLADIVNSSLQNSNQSKMKRDSKAPSTPQQVIFDHPMGKATTIVRFAYDVCIKSVDDIRRVQQALEDIQPLKLDTTETIQEEPEDPGVDTGSPVNHSVSSTIVQAQTPTNRAVSHSRRYIVPSGHPSPFEAALWEAPRIVPAILSFLGDPVTLCRMKLVNRYCNRLVGENEHTFMQDAVRAGGINLNVRPAFWIWIVLEKCNPEESSMAKLVKSRDDLIRLEEEGRQGQWQHVIERDVQRAFGNMPPHKMGARLRTDSIVKALVTWGRSRVMKRGVKGGGEESTYPELGQTKGASKASRSPRHSVSLPPWECAPEHQVDGSDDSSGAPTDTVSDWGPISPVASMTENSTVGLPEDATGEHGIIPNEELALCGSYLTLEMKQDFQKKLRFILHALAASHGDVGYCQGMDYVVAHLLRILQDTIRWNAVQNTLPSCLATAVDLPDFSGRQDEPLAKLYDEVDELHVVEEAIFRFMDIFFTNYNLRHMYWPELRCLKTCCRVFERLIQIKLPVLADHFEHHELNVGLFALGWFQTLFLYLPGMPSETANRLMDIWLIERSFKIFFRVGTAILFLSQPILLNHELEGMMTYLNTIPDATLLKPDILIPCALNIKVTNRMLQEIETAVLS